ncbi:NfeD family protein [Devosia rhodophyticola]|uniref:NfeD family protein n=1 Tax=Devosia rhodophyticola TaxID=3026423 RepID=A0ABY7YV84_9HYPH|nr:NfeD family protein [Devosia rhodophyticola]WDR04839.1 NfeD family protein [Devosia rhodophyticola]
MGIVDFIGQYGAWSWIVAGLVLFGLELLVPGGFLLWLGIAGIATGLIVMVQPIAWPWQWLIFGVLSLVSIALWVRFNRNRHQNSDRPYLNRRADRFVGHESVLEEPVVDGYGRLSLGDTVWRVSGPNLPAGTRVRVVGSEGAVLKVERI